MKQKPEKSNRETLIKPKPKIKREKISAGQREEDKREGLGGRRERGERKEERTYQY